MAASASDACSFPLVLLDRVPAMSKTERMRFSCGRQTPFPRKAYAAVAGDVYFLTKEDGVPAPSKLSHFFQANKEGVSASSKFSHILSTKPPTLCIECERMADSEDLESVERCVYMDGNQLVVSGGGCSGKAASGSDGDEVYCISLFGAAANTEILHGLHRSIQLALMPGKVFVGLFLREPSFSDVVALQAPLQRTLPGSSDEVSNPGDYIANWAEDMNRISQGAGLHASHVGWVSNVGKGIAEIEAGANVADAVARGLSSVAVVGLVFAVVSVAAKGVTLAAETAALRRDFESLYKGLQNTGGQLLNIILQAVRRGFRNEEVVADMVGALTEAWSICQDLERRMGKRMLRIAVKGESANEFRDGLTSRHNALMMKVSHFRSDSAWHDTTVEKFSRFQRVAESRSEEFIKAFRGYPSSPDVVEEALPGLEKLKGLLIPGSKVAVAGCRHQALATRGEGGVGKTTACVLLCNDPAVKEQFPDGIHFLQFGLESSDEQVLSLLCDTLESAGGKCMTESIRDKFKKHSGESDPLGDVADGIKAHFAGRSVLFVCDNVSHRVSPGSEGRQPLARLLQSMVADAPRACLLLTTRYADVARNIRKVVVFERLDTLKAAEAVCGARALIERYADEDATNCARSDARQEEARDKLIAMCGGWQLLLCVCGRMVRESEGDWVEVSDRVENDRGLLLRARPDEEDADPALEAVLTSSLGLLDAAPGRKARAGTSLSDIRGELGEMCFGHLYSAFGILGDVRHVPGRLLRALFAAVRKLARKSQRAVDSNTERETDFKNVCYVACKFLELYGLADVVKGEGDYAVGLHDSKFDFCEALFKTDDLWTSVNVCRVHYEFVREIALGGTSGSTPLCNVDWASICGSLAGRGDERWFGWEANLVRHLVTASGAYMRRKVVYSDVTVRCSDVATSVTAGTDCEHRAVAGSAEDATHVSQESNAVGAEDGNTYSEEAFEWLMRLVTDFRWVRARAFLNGRRGVYQDLRAAFSGIHESYSGRGWRGGVVGTKGVDLFCDDDVDCGYHLKGELAAVKTLRWVILAADEGYFEVPAQRCAAHGMGGNVLCSELLRKGFDFESLAVWSEVGDTARARGQARVRQFVKSAETHVQGPWWKPVLGSEKELVQFVEAETGSPIRTKSTEAWGLGWHCGLVTEEGVNESELMLSDLIVGCPEKYRVAVPSGLRVRSACVVESETVGEGDVVAALDEGGHVFLWRVRWSMSGLIVQLFAEVNAGGGDAEAEAMKSVEGMCIGRGGKVVAVYNRDGVFVWAGRESNAGGAHVFRGALGTVKAGRVKNVFMAKNGGAIVVLGWLEWPIRSTVTCFKEVGEGDFSEAWTIESSREWHEQVKRVAVTGDSSCVYTLTEEGCVSRVDVASGSESALGESLESSCRLVMLEDGARRRVVGVADWRGDVEWWTDGCASADTGAVCGWRGELAHGSVYDLRVRWVDGDSDGGGAGRVFESFAALDCGLWRIRRWRVGADGRVSRADGAPSDVVTSRADALVVRQFAISHARAEAVVAEWDEGVSVWDVRTGARTGVLTRESACAVDVSADGSIAATARGMFWSKDGSVDVWDLRSRERVAVLAGNGEKVSPLLLCDGGGSGGGGSGGGRLWVVTSGWKGTLRVGDCRTGQWLHKVESEQGAIESLGYALPQSCAWHQHERTASVTAPVAPLGGAEPAMHAWIASKERRVGGSTVLWQLSCDAKLTKNPAQPAESTREEGAFDIVFSRDKLSIQDWRQVPCGYGELAVAKDVQAARFADPVAASYSDSGSFWRVALNDYPSLADCLCPPFVLGSTKGMFSFVSMPRAGDAADVSDLGAVTVGTYCQLQIWHLKLSGG